MGRRLLQTDRNAELFIDVLRSLVAERKFRLHDFVIMPDHVHLLLTVGEEMTIEKAMQLIKGGFSYRIAKEFGYAGEVWQRGFTEVRVLDGKSFDSHRAYIAENPVKARLVESPDQYPYCYRFLEKLKTAQTTNEETAAMRQGLKPTSVLSAFGTTEVVPCYKTSGPDLMTIRRHSDRHE